MELKVNRKVYVLDIDTDTPLLWVLRENLGLSGTKFSCGIGACGACTVHVGGNTTRSCLLPVGQVGDREVVTIEGLDGSVGERLKQLWIEEEVPQCGYCPC
jgi:isoquinoline 1-oxidoreductase subunit alpha